MTTTLFFVDQNKSAAEHLLATPFGTRLSEVAEVDPDGAHTWLEVALPDGVTDRLSTGECVMLAVLAGLASGLVAGGHELAFRPHDLHMVDDDHWDAVVVALFISRGRAFAVEAVRAGVRS